MKFAITRTKSRQRYRSRIVKEQDAFDMRFDLGISPTDIVGYIKRIIEMIIMR
jgi:hypothetical protein